MERDGILIFHSIHRVMKAEKVLKAAQIDVRLMPVPRQLSSDCGLSILFFLKDRQAAEEALEAESCPFEALYARIGDGYRRVA